MSHNPYSPPSAVVADVDAPLSLERPRPVIMGVRMLWLSLVVGLPGAIYNLVKMDSPAISKAVLIVFTLVCWAIGFLVFYWIVNSVWKGKNWARIVQLVFIVIGLLFAGIAVPIVFKTGTIMGITYVLQTTLNLAAVTLFFVPLSNAWFRAIKNQ